MPEEVPVIVVVLLRRSAWPSGPAGVRCSQASTSSQSQAGRLETCQRGAGKLENAPATRARLPWTPARSAIFTPTGNARTALARQTQRSAL